MLLETYYRNSPIGVLEVAVSDKGVHRLLFAPQGVVPGDLQTSHHVALQLETELDAYFAGKITSFAVPLVLSGGDFARAVLTTLRDKVPHGATVSYGDLALGAGYPGAARAVGNVMHHNQHMLLVPCHRVLPKSGGVGRYAGSEGTKEWLLQHEGALME